MRDTRGPSPAGHGLRPPTGVAWPTHHLQRPVPSAAAGKTSVAFEEYSASELNLLSSTFSFFSVKAQTKPNRL